jgi:hypothetical protein
VKGRYPIFVAIASAALVVPLLLAATPVKSKLRKAALECGDHVSTSVVLTADIPNCSGFGLFVDANGVTINLNGHTITGTGTASGILVTGRSGVTIENGTISHFQTGVELDYGSNGSRVQALHLSIGANYGVGVFSSNSVVVTGNYVSSYQAYGVYFAGGTNDQAVGNWVEGNGTGVRVKSFGALVSQNRALDNNAGIVVDFGASAQVTANIANGNALDGIHSDSNAVTLTGNRASFNGQDGIGGAFGVKDGGGNVVQDNAFQQQCLNVVCAEVSS